MAHVLNLLVQGGLKELSNPSLNLECSEGEDDEGYEEDVLEVSSQKAVGEILQRLPKLVLLVNSTPQKIFQYKELCEKHKISNKKLLITNVTYDMIIVVIRYN